MFGLSSFMAFLMAANTLSAVAVGRAVAHPPPARIPACGFLAPGSSDSLASASATAIPLSEVGTDSPALQSGQCFL